MDVLRVDSSITVQMTKEEVILVVDALDRAILMIDHHVDKCKVIGVPPLLRELKPISIEFTKILSRL